MNNILKYAAVVILLMSSCTNEDYTQYDTSLKDGIYIEHYLKKLDKENQEVSEIIDSTFYNFGFSDITEFTYNIRCAIMGMPVDYDREISIMMNNSKYADEKFTAAKAEYYSLPNKLIVPKGAVEALIPVTLKRNVELQTVKAILTIELVANENFDVKGGPEFTITFDDNTPLTPKWWDTWEYGAFTKFKGKLFFTYFWEMEQESPYFFNTIVKRWGRNLDIAPLTYADSPINVYDYIFKLYVQQKMWEYSEAHPELDLGISEPIHHQ